MIIQMKTIVIYLFFQIILQNAAAMTRVQLKKTLTIMKNQCMPKHGVTEDQIGKIEQGVFLENPKVMCYIMCIYKTIQVVKNDRLHMESVMDVLYPQDMKVPVKASIKKCLPTQDKYSDPCEAIFYSAKCLYETDPQNFVFP